MSRKLRPNEISDREPEDPEQPPRYNSLLRLMVDSTVFGIVNVLSNSGSGERCIRLFKYWGKKKASIPE